MGALSDSLKERVKKVIHVDWETRKRSVVPDPTTIPAKNYAVELDALIMYADLTESTELVDGYKWWFAGEVYKTYLECAALIIKASKGTIVSYDGDRIIAVFLGANKEDQAVRAALKINGAVHAIINSRIKEVFKDATKYQVKHSIGLDATQIHAAKVGVRDDNDIVWIGKAANRAAKLCSLRSMDRGMYITEAVYSRLSEQNLLSDGKNIWTSFTWARYKETAYRSSYMLESF